MTAIIHYNGQYEDSIEIEGWDKKEYLNQLKSVIEHFEKKGGEAE